MDKLIVTAIGALSLGGIYWFFFRQKDQIVASKTMWTITVDGGYHPKTITIPKDKATKIIFTRTDPNSCLEEVIIPDFKIKTFLPLNEPVTITLSPTKSGTFGIHCGMNMFHGNIVVTT